MSATMTQDTFENEFETTKGTDLMEREIHCSHEYDKFMPYKMQRGLDPLHVIKLRNSMVKRGFVQSKPITVGPDYTIRDGQHRFEAAKHLGLSFFFIIEDLDVEDVRQMERLVKKWTVADYVTSYIRQGHEDYRKLYDYFAQSGLKSWDVFLRCGVLSGQRITAREDFLAGKWALTDYKKEAIETFLSRYELFHDSFPGWNHRNFVTALACMFNHPKYNHEQMAQRLDYQQRKLVRCPDTQTYLDLLEHIYNFNSRKDSILHFEYSKRNR